MKGSDVRAVAARPAIVHRLRFEEADEIVREVLGWFELEIVEDGQTDPATQQLMNQTVSPREVDVP